MPEPNPNPAKPGENWMNGAPPDDFDALFPPVGAETPQAPPQGTPPPPAEPFLTAQSGTVYKTREDAIKGTEEKDALIKSLRERWIAEKGIDPVTNKQVGAPPQPAQPPAAPPNYLQDQNRYFMDLQKAVEAKDPRAYLETQAQLVRSVIDPYRGVIQQAAEFAALQGLPEDVQKFVRGPDFTKTLESDPLLAGAVQQAKNDPQYSAQLPGLYNLTYKVHLAQQLPELLKQQQAAPGSPPPPRPTLAPATQTPPATPSVQPGLESRDGRKAIIQRAEQSGLMDMRW